jgi:hypothetical protein
MHGFKEFGENITLIINSILLSFVYFSGVGFTAIFARIIKKHFLETKLTKDKTYWQNLNLEKKPIEEYYRQF